jgi:hypothetical protein
MACSHFQKLDGIHQGTQRTGSNWVLIKKNIPSLGIVKSDGSSNCTDEDWIYSHRTLKRYFYIIYS